MIYAILSWSVRRCKTLPPPRSLSSFTHSIVRAYLSRSLHPSQVVPQTRGQMVGSSGTCRTYFVLEKGAALSFLVHSCQIVCRRVVIWSYRFTRYYFVWWVPPGASTDGDQRPHGLRMYYAFYDRSSTFPPNYLFFCERRGSLTQTRRNANLVSKKEVIVYLLG